MRSMLIIKKSSSSAITLGSRETIFIVSSRGPEALLRRRFCTDREREKERERTVFPHSHSDCERAYRKSVKRPRGVT